MNRTARILVVDDKPSFRFLLQAYLEAEGHCAVCVGGGAQALAALASGDFELVLSDLVMPDMDGNALLHQVRARHGRLPFVLVTAHGSIDGAVAAMKEGADDYLLKPVNRAELLLLVARLLEQAEVRVSYDRMLAREREKFSFQSLTSASPAMGEALAAARQVAAAPGTTVAIYGESGVGKEVLARAIHAASGKDMTSFVAMNCAAIPETLLESELFGHVKGAFTGADRDRQGKCARARGGVLFLDEIGDMPLALQPKLLRLLEERVYEKVGSDHPVRAEFRIMVATHQDLEQCCAKGTFRRDLFHRLTVFPITIPPLRQRREDIAALAETFMEDFRQHHGKPVPGLSPEALDLMLAHDWPGNVRELRNRLEYATIVNTGGLIQPGDLRLQRQDAGCVAVLAEDRINLNFSFAPEAFSLEALTREAMAWALQRSGGNKSSAARLLKASRKLFYPAGEA